MCPLLFQSPEEVFMEIRRPLEWHCKQMDHFVGLNFSANFNFALVGHLLKGKVASDRNNYLQTVISCSQSRPGPKTYSVNVKASQTALASVFFSLFPSFVSRLQTPVSHYSSEDGENSAHAVGSHQQASEM